VFKKTTLYVKFLRFFRIDEHSLKQVLNWLKQAIKNFEYLRLPKNMYLFCQGDPSKQFFGIINGAVSLRLRKKVNFSKEINKAKLPIRNKSKFNILI
jgi:queuine/archaeosine tRNA-ribosyltransferase